MAPSKKRNARSSDGSTTTATPEQLQQAAKDALPKENKTVNVERIDVNAPGSMSPEELRAKIDHMLYRGIPFVIVNHQGWTAFANNWVKKDGKLDVNALVGDLGGPKTMVPVIRPASYDGDPISEMELGQFIKKHWEKNDRGAYLHQWQFTDNPAVRANLCGEGKHVPLDVLGLDLLSYYHSDEEKKTYGAHDSDYQYLFWGGEEVPSPSTTHSYGTGNTLTTHPTPLHPTAPHQTETKMHKDAGGQTITISVLHGVKSVWMVHRSEGPSLLALDLAMPAVGDIDSVTYPMAALVDMYHVDLTPGEFLVMPAGASSPPCPSPSYPPVTRQFFLQGRTTR